MRADFKALALFAQIGLGAAGCIKAKGRAAGQDEAVDGFDRVVRLEQVGFPCARRAAKHLHGCGGGWIADNGCHAGIQPGITGIADGEARDIGDQVTRPGLHYRLSPVIRAASSMLSRENSPSLRMARTNPGSLRSPF